MATRNLKAATRPSRAYAAALAVAVGTLAASGLAFAGDGPAQRCIALSSIERTEVVDDSTILFRMRNGDVYRNVLRATCRTLKDREQFAYRVNAAQLCAMDLITVLETHGLGLAPGPSCSLGSFEPVSSSAAQ